MFNSSLPFFTKVYEKTYDSRYPTQTAGIDQFYFKIAP